MIKFPTVALAAACVLSVVAGGAAQATNTGGVFGPVVNQGHQSVQQRSAFQPGRNDAADGFAQRIHYERSINDSLMWRIVGQTRKTADSNFDFDFVQAELFWQISGNGAPWQTGLRFDGRLRDGDRANQIGLNWMNQFTVAEGVTARAVALTTLELGDAAADGVGIGTRASLAKSFEGGISGGFELYNSYGTTENWRDLDDQIHQLGPFVSMPAFGGIGIYAGALFGLTDASPDSQFRFWVTRNF